MAIGRFRSFSPIETQPEQEKLRISEPYEHTLRASARFFYGIESFLSIHLGSEQTPFVSSCYGSSPEPLVLVSR